MSILLFLIPVTFTLSLIGLCCFLWSLKNRQYDDLEGAASRILFDDLCTEKQAKITTKIIKKQDL